MRKLLAIITISLLLVLPCWADTLLDDFNRATLGGNWNSGYGANRDCTIYSNTLTGGTDDWSCFATWAVATYSGDQTAIISINTLSTSGSVSLLVKASAPPTRTFYRCTANVGFTDTTQITRYDDGTPTILNSETGTTWVATNEVKCTTTGTNPITIRMYQNGVEVLNATDSTSPLSGNLIGASCGAVTATNCRADDFKTADIAPPAGTAGNIMVITVD